MFFIAILKFQAIFHLWQNRNFIIKNRILRTPFWSRTCARRSCCGESGARRHATTWTTFTHALTSHLTHGMASRRTWRRVHDCAKSWSTAESAGRTRRVSGCRGRKIYQIFFWNFNPFLKSEWVPKTQNLHFFGIFNIFFKTKIHLIT